MHKRGEKAGCSWYNKNNVARIYTIRLNCLSTVGTDYGTLYPY